MSQLLTSGIVGNTSYNYMKDIRKQVNERWDGIGFLDGLKGNIKDNMAQLYENTATNLIKESTTADSSGSFETVVFPIVRRVFSKLLANDIVSVQALNMPIGKLFFFIPITSERVNSNGNPGNPYDPTLANAHTYSAHTAMGNSLPSCISCVQDQEGKPVTPFKAKNLYDLYYNDGLFDNSKGTITIVTNTGHNPGILLPSGEFSATTTFTKAADGTTRNLVLQVSGFSSTNAGRLTGADGNEMDTEAFLASLKVTNGATDIKDPNGNVIVGANAEIPFRLVSQKYGKGIVDYSSICDAKGYIYLDLDLSAPVGLNGTSTFDGYIGATGATSQYSATSSTFGASWARYASLENESEMGEVSFKLDEVVVSVEERRLRATWSPELAQDVQAFQNIDAEAELTAMLSEQVASEIDREILKDLRKGAAWQLKWDYAGWRKAATSANPYTQKDWNQTLITKVNQISAQIHKTTLRGGANFIVVSSEISAVFNDLEYFHVSDASADKDQYNMGIEKIGTLSGRYQVYCDPYSPANSMIIGHKGTSLLDTGFIYAPYVPLQLTPTMTNFMNFSNVKGIITRYAKKFVNNKYYGALRADNIPTFNMNELR